MKIALTNENSQDFKPLTYVQIGILAGELLNSGAADYVATGCSTGEHFQEHFFTNATDEAIIAKVKEILGL